MECHLEAVRPRIIIEGYIARVPKTAGGIWEQGWAPRKVGAIVNIMLPVRVSHMTHGTMMSLSPTKMGNLRGINGTTQ